MAPSADRRAPDTPSLTSRPCRLLEFLENDSLSGRDRLVIPGHCCLRHHIIWESEVASFRGLAFSFSGFDDCFLPLGDQVRLSRERDTGQFPSRIATPVSYSVSPSHLNLIIPPRARPRLSLLNKHHSHRRVPSSRATNRHTNQWQQASRLPPRRVNPQSIPLALPRHEPLKSKSDRRR